MASNRILNQEANKGNKKSPLSTSGIAEEIIKEDKPDIVNKEENKKDEEVKPENKVQTTETEKDIKTQEIAIEKTEAEIVQPQNENLFELFNIKKKEKIQKGQKNLVLKLSNIEFLEELAHSTKRDQGEIVDTLLENLAKMMSQ